MYCPYCGEEVKEGQKFCSQTGELLPLDEVPEKDPVSQPPVDPGEKPSGRKVKGWMIALILVAVLAIVGGVVLAVWASNGGLASDVAASSQSKTEANDPVPPQEESAPAAEEPTEEPQQVPVSDEERELLEYMAVAYWSAVHDILADDELVSGAKNSDQAWLIRELAYPGYSSWYRMHSANIINDAGFDFNTSSVQVNGGFFMAVSELEGRIILSSFLGEENAPQSDAATNEIVLFDGTQFLIRSADGGGGKTIESSDMVREGTKVMFDCEFISMSSAGEEFDRTIPFHVTAEADDASLFGYHLVAMEPKSEEPPADTTQATDALAPHDAFWGVWIGSSENENAANEIAAKAFSEGYSAEVILTTDWANLNREPWFVVTSGRFATELEAQKKLTTVQKAGYKDAYVKYTANYVAGV